MAVPRAAKAAVAGIRSSLWLDAGIVLSTDFLKLLTEPLVHHTHVYRFPIFDALRDHGLWEYQKCRFLVANRRVSAILILNHPPVVILVVLYKYLSKRNAQRLE